MPRLAAALFLQLQVADDHAAVDGFHHVVHREQADRGKGISLEEFDKSMRAKYGIQRKTDATCG